MALEVGAGPTLVTVVRVMKVEAVVEERVEVDAVVEERVIV